MNVSDLVKFNRDNFYNGAVQTEWFYDDAKVASIASSYVFHGPKYYGVSTSDVKTGEHKLLDTASYVQRIAEKVSGNNDNNFVLTIARYGTGKSHLAVTMGALLSGESDAQNAVLKNIETVDSNIATDIKKRVKKKNLIIALNGMRNFNLDSEILRCVREALKKENVDDSILRTITKTYDIARYFIESNFDACSSDFITAAKKSQLLIDAKNLKEYLLQNIETDNHVIDTVNIVLKKMTGDSLHWEQGISAGEIILKVSQELCGEGRPFNKLVILFDEFGRYIEYVAANPAVAGDASLQQVFEAIQSADGMALFVGFIQYELEAYLSHIDKASNVIRYVGRYSTSEKYYLSSNFETILANLLEKNSDGSFEKVIERAFTRYKSFHERMHSAILRWSDGRIKKNVWLSNALYRNVIMEGCYPLHPLTVWILSNSEGWMQQRSTISFCAEMVDKVSTSEVEGDWLPYVYPVDIIDSEIFAEMLNSEEEGRVKSQNCMLYNEICTKIGDKLSYEENLVLKAVLVTKIAGFKFYDKEDACTAFRYCSNLKEEQIKLVVKNLEDRHGVISYDDQAKTYDLIAEANGFNEFKRIFVRYKTGITANIEDADEEMLSNIQMNIPIETSFAQENHISSNEWKFEKRLLNSTSIDESYISSLIRTLDSAYDGETYRGAVLYAYCSEDSENEIIRLSDVCSRMNVEETPIIVLFLDDADGEILSAMTVKNTIKRFSSADAERFSKHIIAQNKGKDKKISQKFNAMVIERKRITPDGLAIYEGRLSTLCSERFSKVYKTPVPFMFDGFESSKSAQAKKTLINLCVKMIDHSLMNVQSYQALNTQDKNRVKACLATGSRYSWQVFNESCNLVLPQNELMKKIYEEVDALIPEEDSVSINKLFGKYLHAPYGMNMYSYTLFVLYFIEKHEQYLLAYFDKNRLTADNLSNNIFKGQKFKISDIQQITVRRNLNVDVDLVANICNEILESSDVNSCGKLRRRLNDTILAEGEGSKNQLLIGQAKLRLDDGERLKKHIEDNQEKIKQFLDEARSKLILHKFVGVFAYIKEPQGLIESGLPFVYPQSYVDFMLEAKKHIRDFMGEKLDEALLRLECSDITKLSAFKNTYSRAAAILRDNHFDKQAESVENRVVQIEEETKARNKHSQALSECEKDISLFSGAKRLSYVECETVEDKFSGWIKYLSETQLPTTITKPLRDRIDEIIKTIQSRKEDIKEDVDAIAKELKDANSKEDLLQVKTKIEVIINNDLPDEMEISVRKRLVDIDIIIQEIESLPIGIEALKSIIDGEQCLNEVTCKEAQTLLCNLLDKQDEWISRVIIPVEEGKISDAQQCSSWINRLREIPEYVDSNTTARAKKAEDIVTHQLHDCKVQGVLSLYNSLTQEEKDEFIKLIQK